jgi:glycosyltransferase involved in cell wall biosynthesis
VGNAYPHKNIEILLEAFLFYLRNYQKDLQLVLVGKKDYFYERMKEYAFKLGLLKDNKVVFWGFASRPELKKLFKSAKCYVFPSLMEGFGIPPLEAMGYKLPVLASNASCLPEILGDAVLYFDPLNHKDIAVKIDQMVNDQSLREDLVKKAISRINKYSWDKCAKQTLSVYKDILYN